MTYEKGIRQFEPSGVRVYFCCCFFLVYNSALHLLTFPPFIFLSFFLLCLHLLTAHNGFHEEDVHVGAYTRIFLFRLGSFGELGVTGGGFYFVVYHL